MVLLAIPFDNPSTYPGHSGVDFGQRSGTIVRASGKGRVIQRGWINNNAGNGVVIAYDNGPDVLYCHFDNLSHVPGNGSAVDVYGAIGTVGTTGRSTGPHLHMEIMRGVGAHTYAGVWNYFSVKTVQPASNESKPFDPADMPLIGDEMLIADMPNGTFLLIPNPTGGKLRPVVLDAGAIRSQAGTPRFAFNSENSRRDLARIVEGWS